MLALALLASLTTRVAQSAGPTCTYTPQCDYGKGDRASAPAATKEICCSLCQAKGGCAAGVLTDGTCWFKTAEEVAGGCTHSSKVDFACGSGTVPTPAPAPTCASPACQVLEQKYESMKNATCSFVRGRAPSPQFDTFMKLYHAYVGGTNESDVIAAATSILRGSAIAAFFALSDTFTAGGLDASMVLCAVLTQGTPLALAEFAHLSAANEALVAKLLADPILMRDMLVAGGAVMSETDKGKTGAKHYGEAMAIYEQILAASSDDLTGTAFAAAGALWDDRSQENILHRFALGTALEHAVPIHLHYGHKVSFILFYILLPLHFVRMLLTI